MANRSTSGGRIPEMDGLRALAIGAVMIEHFAGAPIRHVLPWGAFGVQLFFALSSFLITSLLLEAPGSLSWHVFERPLRRLPELQMWREAPAS